MRHYTTEYLEEIQTDLEQADERRRQARPHRTKVRNSFERSDIVTDAIVEQLGEEQRFRPTYVGSKYERAWLYGYLGPFYTEHVIADVLRQVKGGKEAMVYCCRADPRLGIDLIAAKVYRPKMFRTLKNDAEYRRGLVVLDDQGNEVRGRREALAMKKKTQFGQELLHTAWLTNEYQALVQLYAAGADVPKPLAQSDNAILMEYLGDARTPAPALHQVRLPSEQAQPLFDRLMRNVELALAHGRVHADLSAFNVLYWQGDLRIIDWPQAVDPYANPSAFKLFERDVVRLCQYFARYGIAADGKQLARRMWARHVQRDASEIFLQP